jgi:hypothetical protein
VPLLNSNLIHPTMLTELTPKFFPDAAAIQYLPTETLNALHDPSAQTDFVTVAGLAAIPCNVSNRVQRMQDEMRTVKTTYVSTNFWIVLNGCYPQIVETMSVLVTHPEGQVRYNINSIYVDSLRKITKLEGQVVL